MNQYLDLLDRVMDTGVDRADRTGTGTRSAFGHQMRFDLSKGFPIVTTKKLHWKSIAHELLWLLSGDTNIKYLTDNGISIWAKWATGSGELGPVYGEQWRRWKTANSANSTQIDQIARAVHDIKTRPNSRRIIISAWNPADLPDEDLSPQENVEAGRMALAPCHAFFQFYVSNGKLSCMLTQRSADCFLGVPFNIASYALLTHMIAQQCDLDVGELIWSGGDVHIYHNHFEQVAIQRVREPTALPKLTILRKPDSIFDYKIEDFELSEYQSWPHIAGKVSV